MKSKIFKIFLVLCVSYQYAWACRSAAFDDSTKRFIAKSFDFDVAGGNFFKGEKGVQKSALLLKPDHEPLTWKSKFATITFSQIGPGFPFGGMNEAGLTVEALWLTETKEAVAVSRLAINESQFIQYILDVASNLNEAENLALNIHIEKAFASIHYFICDKNKDCGVVENTVKGISFIRLKDKQDQVVENILQEKMLEAKTSNPIYASYVDHKRQSKPSVGSAFDWLEKVKTPGWSRWQIVYDIQKLELHFRELNNKGEAISQGSIPIRGTLGRFMTRHGPASWNKTAFEKNMTLFIEAFPHFKQFTSILKNYLQNTFQ